MRLWRVVNALAKTSDEGRGSLDPEISECGNARA